jgi:CBS domain-containing protein
MHRLERTIEEIGWTRDVPRLADTDPVATAIELMKRDAHDCVLVLAGGALVGIFTSRDFLNRVAAVRGDPTRVQLGTVMTPTPRTLRPDDEIAFGINWMAVEGYRNIPIVDGHDHPLGVLTVWDVMRHLGDIFDEIDAAPRPVPPQSDISNVVELVDAGGEA